MTVTINGTTGIANDGGYTGDGVVFADTTPANTLVTTTGGNVGIGTSSPALVYSDDTTLTVNGKQSATSYRSALELGNNGSLGAFYFCSTANAVLGSYANIPLAFRTNNTERARIDTSGNLLVGTTSVSSTAGRAIILSTGAANETFVAINHDASASSGGYFMGFRYNGTFIGNIAQNGTTATSYNTSSDYRLKHDIAPMTGALAKLELLKPCTYKWNADGSDGEGFIAHELAEVCPGAVTGEKDAVDADGNPVYQGIDTSFLVATLTAAIQELKAINDAQAETITALTARVTALDTRLTSLEGTQP